MSSSSKSPTDIEVSCCLTSAEKTRKDIFTCVPPQQMEKKNGQLTPELIQQFFKAGYLVIKDFFPKDLLDACRKDIDTLVDDLANSLFKAGKIKNLYQEYDFFTRLIHIEKEFPGANIILHKHEEVPAAFQQLWTYEQLLNIVEQVIGPDIMGHPVWNLRTKVPNNEATVVPWHQDCAYLDDDALDVLQLTAWIPFVDANLVNGTLQVIEGGHKDACLAKHVCCNRGTWYVEILDDDLKILNVDLEQDVKTCEVPYGGMVLFSNMLPHQSLPNLSQITRWSCDLRWQTPNKSPGLWGLKQGIVLRMKGEPNHTPDWAKFNNACRNKLQMEAVELANEAYNPFNTTLSGPWMKKWEIVNPNRHTESYRDQTV